jgi:hypothetical protein
MRTSAPSGLVVVTRIRAPGDSERALPSEKRASRGFAVPAATQSPTTPSVGGSPGTSAATENVRGCGFGVAQGDQRNDRPAIATQAAAARTGPA